jgi:hypothetical protein
VAWVHYRQLDKQTYLVMRLLPRCTESLQLRPITGSVQLEVPVGSPEHQAVEDWLRYGAPFHNVPGTVTNVSGPPRLPTSSGPGRFSFMAATETDSDWPDLELRLLATDDSVAHTLELVGMRVSRGLDGPGMWLSGTDRAGVLEFRFLLGGPDRDQVRMTMATLIGKTPADVLPAVHRVAGLASGAGLVLAVRGGRPLTPVWHPKESEIRASPFVGMAHWTVALLEALLAIQAHTYQRVTIPDLEEITPDQIAEIIRLGRLLRGEEIHATWTQITMTLGAEDHLPPPDLEFSLLGTNQLQVNLAGRQIILDDVQRRVLYHSARAADPRELTSARSGDTIRLVPGSIAKATIVVVPSRR